MKRMRLFWAFVACALIAAAWWQTVAAATGLTVRRFEREGTPMVFLARTGAQAAPGVLVAHGFAGSKQLMLAYGYTLAHAGYAVILWDFAGHGGSSATLTQDALQRDLDRAYAALIEQPEVDRGRLALVGHSMGSGAVMTAGIRNPERYAAMAALSPTSAAVSPASPRNLLLQAGSWEGRFVANAERLLAAAGGASADFAGGRARQLTVIPNAEHITILFRTESHRGVLDWLGQAFQPARTTAYVDRRILWYLAHLAGWLLLIVAARPWLAGQPQPADRPARRGGWLGLIVGPLAASLGLAALNLATPVAGLGGIQVGGAVGLWFLIAGAVWLALTRSLARPALREIGLGVGLFVVLWLAFGALAQSVWVQWLLNPARLLRWPVLALACLPWFLAAGSAYATAGAGRRALWWLGQSAATLVGLYLALTVVPGLGVLVLLLPLLPVVLGVMAIAGSAFRPRWAYGLAATLFFGWVLAAVFPLAGV